MSVMRLLGHIPYHINRLHQTITTQTRQPSPRQTLRLTSMSWHPVIDKMGCKQRHCCSRRMKRRINIIKRGTKICRCVAFSRLLARNGDEKLWIASVKYAQDTDHHHDQLEIYVFCPPPSLNYLKSIFFIKGETALCCNHPSG